MKLIELSPKKIEKENRWVGIMFLCPHCKDVWLTCYFECTPMHDQIDTMDAMLPEASNAAKIVPVRQDFAWTRQGDSFVNLTITPSINAEASGHWHGFITNGEIT